MKTFIHVFFFVASFFSAQLIMAQSDDCPNATVIPNVTNYCSGTASETTVGATGSNALLYTPPSCWGAMNNDVWYSFTATATDVVITVNGASALSPGGTLTSPEIALVEGTCSALATNFTELECVSDVAGNNFVELYKGGLTPGDQYFIWIDAANAQEGTFELCVNNYNPPAFPTSDCPTASILCDKSSFNVQSVVGSGVDPLEIDDANCFQDPLSPIVETNLETNSVWFVWTAANNGTLEFTLTPSNPSDDLDFVVYQLPNGPGDCSGKIVERCMAAGDNIFPSDCMGPTGLAAGSTDLSEDLGCQPLSCIFSNIGCKDNFLAPLNMTAGTTYALAVNNYTSTGTGFQIDFGGTGEFVGPDAAFTDSDPDNSICTGETITFTDGSTYPLGTITDYSWTFSGGTPASANTPGPHTITFNTPGTATATLTVESSDGCLVTVTETYTIQQCCALDTDVAGTNATCSDSDNGTITISTLAGSPTMYTWSPNVSTTATATGLAPGNYSVTVSEGAGCQTIETFTVTAPPALDVTQTSTVDPTCGAMDGSFTVTTVTGGTGAYTYDFGSGNSASNTATGLGAGSYTVTVTDANGCTTTEPATLTSASAATIDNTQSTNPACGVNDGSITLTVSGGTGTLTYTWSPNVSTTNAATGLGAGTYNITVTDAAGCETPTSVTLANSAAPTIDNTQSTNPACGVNDGSITLTVSGGTGTLTYTWSPNVSTTNAATGLGAGTYNITVTDAAGCETPTSVTLANSAAPTIDNTQSVDPSCTNDDGSITLTASGGTGALTYTWLPNVSSGNAATGLASGTYNITVTDAAGCETPTSVTLTNSAAATINITNQVDPTCANNNGAIGINATGGTAPYTYTWSPNVSTTNSASGLGAGQYDITVTDAAGCVTPTQITLNIPTSFPIFNPPSISNPTCNGNDGSINLNVAGGAGPYTYTWSPNISSGSSASGLGNGFYNVTVTDANSCTNSTTIDMTGAPNVPVATIGNQINTNCGSNNGQIELNVAGGSAPFTYDWSGNVSTGIVAFNLTAGNYSVTVTDANNCTSIVQTTITGSTGPVLDDAQAIDPDCGEDNGQISLTVTPGTSSNLTYAWDPASAGSTAQLTGLSGGSYNVTITDDNGCEITTGYFLNSLTPPTTSVGSDLTIEPGENVTLVAAPNNPDYTYTWTGSDGSTFTGNNINVSPQEEVTYSVSVSYFDCPEVSDQLTVFVLELEAFAIPNAFSPNEDGLNDDFFILGTVEVLDFQVYNRWGERVHDNVTTGWDGRYKGELQPSDTYVYYIRVRRNNGVEETFSGDVTLIR